MTKDKSSQRPQKKQDNQRLGRGLSSLLGDRQRSAKLQRKQAWLVSRMLHPQVRAALRCQAAKSGRYQLNGLFRALATQTEL